MTKFLKWKLSHIICQVCLWRHGQDLGPGWSCGEEGCSTLCVSHRRYNVPMKACSSFQTRDKEVWEVGHSLHEEVSQGWPQQCSQGQIESNALHCLSQHQTSELFQNQTDYGCSLGKLLEEIVFFLTSCLWRAHIMGPRFSSASIPSKEYSMRNKLVSQNNCSSHQECWLT